MKIRSLVKGLVVTIFLFFVTNAFAEHALFYGSQSNAVKVTFGVTGQQFTLQFNIVNKIVQPQPITNFKFVPIGTTTNPVTVLGFANTCNGVVPPQGPNGICTVFVEISANGIQTSNSSAISPVNYQFSLQYGVRKITLNANPVGISFATGQPVQSLSRTFNVVNNCSFPVWVGVASGATNSIHPDPSTSPLDLQSCLSDTDCYPGSVCIQVQTSPTALSHCFWSNPEPDKINLSANDTTTVTFPVFDNGIPTIWNGGIAARTNCTGDGCQTGDCGGADQVCPVGQSFATPVSTADFTLQNSSSVGSSNAPNTAVDNYNVVVNNGVTVPVSMAPANATWGGATAPYTCGTSGGVTAQSPLGACSWNFTPPSNDFVFVSLNGTPPTSCSTNTDCTSPDVCGLSYDPDAAPGSQINKTCGTFLGYWTAEAVCAKDPLHNVAPFTCTIPVQGSLTFADLYGCSTGELSQSCYSAGAASTCCGCVNWDSLGVTVPASPLTQACNAVNTNWINNSQPKLLWLKSNCPTVSTYPFDTASSAFSCQALNSQNINSTNYTVTFCPT